MNRLWRVAVSTASGENVDTDALSSDEGVVIEEEWEGRRDEWGDG